MMMWALIGIVGVLFLIAFMIYKLPSDPTPKARKKEKKEDPAVQEQKNWQEIAGRWEKKNMAITGELEQALTATKKVEKELQTAKAQVKDLLEKMAQEKSWREKEEGNLNKSRTHEKELKDQVILSEKELAKEHSLRLQIARELEELKTKHDAITEEKRVLAVNAASLETTVKALRIQVKDLLRENEELKRRKEDIQWVAKSEYDQLAERHKSLTEQYNKIKDRA